ncbi:MAG: hypothetical protein ACLQJ7_11825 [Syntrophobacteraceae bacterium]
MITDSLGRFDLHFPSHLIEGEDRDWAWENKNTLDHVQSLFIEAVAAYSLFRPITVTADNVQEFIQNKENESPYQACLNGLYAKAFVFALHSIGKLLSHLTPPVPVRDLFEKYESQFGHLKHIRDSAIHIEDRGRGKTRYQEHLKTNVIILGSFIENRFMFTGEDGKQYEVEVSETTLLKAKAIIQDIINVYPWVPVPDFSHVK